MRQDASLYLWGKNNDTNGDGLIDGFNTTHDPWNESSRTPYVESSLYSGLIWVPDSTGAPMWIGELSLTTDPHIPDTDGVGAETSPLPSPQLLQPPHIATDFRKI